MASNSMRLLKCSTDSRAVHEITLSSATGLVQLSRRVQPRVSGRYRATDLPPCWIGTADVYVRHAESGSATVYTKGACFEGALPRACAGDVGVTRVGGHSGPVTGRDPAPGRIRASASSQSAALGSLRPGSEAELVGSVPSWYEVRLANGVLGFVAKRWTRVVSATAPPPRPASASTYTMDVFD